MTGILAHRWPHGAVLHPYVVGAVPRPAPPESGPSLMRVDASGAVVPINRREPTEEGGENT